MDDQSSLGIATEDKALIWASGCLSSYVAHSDCGTGGYSARIFGTGVIDYAV